jgi:hypothetical protein
MSTIHEGSGADTDEYNKNNNNNNNKSQDEEATYRRPAAWPRAWAAAQRRGTRWAPSGRSVRRQTRAGRAG